MSNLLKDASILLTPTGYDNGSMNAIKPENGDGDFTFSRNSAATRVNAQGLVENVQILSSNLVSNGDFSQEGAEQVTNGSFSQEGSELVTNGDFATDSNWTKQNGSTISNSEATVIAGNDNIGNGRANHSLYQDNVFEVGKSYLVTFKAKQTVGSGLFQVGQGTAQSLNIATTSSFVTYTWNFTATSNTYETSLVFGGRTSLNEFVIDNVSVKEVGQDWTLGTGWSIGEDKAVRANASDNTPISQVINVVSGKTYNVSYTRKYISGGGQTNLYSKFITQGVNLTLGNYDSQVQESIVVTTQFTPTYSGTLNLQLYGIGTFNGDITNISVKEVGQNWTLGTGWSIGDNKAVANTTGNFVNLYQNSTFVVGKTYKTTFTISDYTQGSVRLSQNGYDISGFQNAVGTYTTYFTASQTDLYMQGHSSFIGSVTNISVIEITDDTNLPRINYEGFSYQDSLGSEEIVNGDFATDSDWNKGANTTISEGTLNSTSAGVYIIANQPNVATQNKYYKWEATYTITSGEVRLGFSSGVFTGSNQTSSGTYTGVFQAPSGINGQIYITSPSSDFVGSIDNISVKEYLGQEVVPNSGCGSWLLEPQSTNLLPYSEDFSQWNIKQGTETINYGISPEGVQNSTRIVFVGSNLQFANTLTTISGTTGSIYVKGISGKTIRFGLEGSENNFTLNGNWQKLEIFGTRVNNKITINTFAGATARDIEVWGAQVEAQPYSTSYIPTNGATSTRLQDIANNSGNASLINSEEGVLYAEISAFEETNSFESISINNNTIGDRVFMGYYSDDLYITVVNGGQAKYDVSTPINVKQNNKIAVKYKAQDFCFYLNGFKINASVGINGGTTPIGLSKLSFDRGDGVEPFYGKTKALAVYKTALTDANLRSLTYPSAVATTFDLNFNTIADDFTFTRGSEATFVNAQGLIQSTASNDAPRLDYSTGAKAFLLEPQSTNIIPYSEDFTLGWNLSDATIVSNSTISPNGLSNASKLTTSVFGGGLSDSFAVSDGNLTFSLFVKKGTTNGIRLRIDAATDSNGFFDLVNNTVYSSDNEASIKSFGNGWYKISVSANITSFSKVAIYTTDGSSNYENGSVYIYGAQLEQNSFSTSYIPTSGASATRNQESCTNATPVINSEEGTLYFEASALVDENDRRISLSDGSLNNYVSIGYSRFTGNIIGEIFSNGVSQNLNWGATGITQINNNKFALSWGNGTMKFYVNGIQTLTTTITSPIGMNVLNFTAGNNALTMYANTKDLKVYPKALADVQLQDLTSWGSFTEMANALNYTIK